MKLSLSFFIFLLTGSFSLFPQEYKVTGHVKDGNNAPIAFANVLLLKSSDSTVFKGAATDDYGFFEIGHVPLGNYFIKASYIENESVYLSVKVTSDKDVGTLVLENDAQKLNEVVVTSQKPRIERKVDRLVFNIENTALADGDIWEVLKRTPGIVVLDNELTVKGSSNIGIMINGRLVNLPKADIIDLLSGTTASNVEAVEVITNPPAKYSAEDGTLINIKMKKNLVAGYNGAIFNRYTQGVFPKHTVGTDHYFKGKKVAFSINYAFSNNTDITRYTDITNFFDNGDIISIWTADLDNLRKRKKHNISTFLDYTISDKNTLSFSSISSWSPKVVGFIDTKTLITNTNDTPDSSFNTTNNSDQSQLNTSYYLDFVHSLNKEGAELSFNTHYTLYDYDRGQALETDFLAFDGELTSENDFTTQSSQRINLFSIQADYSTPLGKSSRIETGLRYAGIASKSNISQLGFDRDQPGIDPTEAGEFVYDESIYAIYAGFDTKWEKWKLKSGLRAEYTETLGDLDSNETPNENDYLELFPSFSLQFSPNKKHDFNLYYYRRITRPRYNSINPFQTFQSNFSVVEGNPDLLPAIRHYLAGGYTFNKDYTVELFYRNEKNTLRQLVFQDNDAMLLRFINSNLDSNIRYGLDLSVNRDFTSFWNCYLLSSFYQGEYTFTDLDSGQLLKTEQFTWYFRANNSLTPLKDNSLTIDVNFFYASPIFTGNSRQEEYNELSVSLRKTLWDKKASISIGLEDIFNQGNIFRIRNFLDQNNTSLRRQENRLFTLGFRHKFGNVKIRNNKRPKRVNERNRL